MKLKTIIAILAVLALSVTGTAFALAESETEEKIPEIVLPEVAEPEAEEAIETTVEETAEEAPVVIERRDRTNKTEEFTVMFNDRLDGTEDVDDTLYFYRSVKDAVADYSDGYYCPTGMDESFVDILYNARGVNKEGPVVFQIHYYSDDFDMVWLYPGTGHFGIAPDEEVYVSNGNTFYIGEFFDGHEDGYLAWGVIDGNTYQVHTSTAEKAKLIIDSFEKAE